jgi:hypothetical protein
MKTCSVCKKAKPLSEFYRNKWARDGRRSECRECSKPLQKRYRAKYLASEKGKAAVRRASVMGSYRRKMARQARAEKR